MEVSTINEKLDRLTSIFLQEEDDYHLLTAAISEYKELLVSLSGLDLTAAETDNSLRLEGGTALGTRWAAACIDDLLRTKRFIKGTYEAVKSLSAKGCSPVHILYAGTGPFATLVLPLTRKFTPSEIQFTLLEINPLSFSCLKKIINVLGIDDHIIAAENVDAREYRINKTHKVDILLCESMQHALLREQQVSIVASLAAQMGNELLLIPGKIELQLAVFSFEKHHQYMMENKNDDNYYEILGIFFELSKDTLHFLPLQEDLKKSPFKTKQVKIDIPVTAAANKHDLCVLTQISIFGNERLGLNESGLTIPYILTDLSHYKNNPLSISIAYMIAKEPSIEFEFNKAPVFE
jgi:hypothetical protein